MKKATFNPLNNSVYKKLPTPLAELMERWKNSYEKQVILLTMLKEIGIFYPNVTSSYKKYTLNPLLGIDFDENDELITIGLKFAKLAINRTEESLNYHFPFPYTSADEYKQIELRLKKEHPNHAKYIEHYINIIIGNHLYNIYRLLRDKNIKIAFDPDQINNMEKYWHQVYSTPYYLRNVFFGNEREAMLMTMKIAIILTILRIDDAENEIKPFYFASKKDFLNARDIATVAIRHSRVINTPAEIKTPQRNLFHENMIKHIPLNRDLTRIEINSYWKMPVTTSDYIIKELVESGYLIPSEYGLTYRLNSTVLKFA